MSTGTTAKHDGLFCELYWGDTRNEVWSFGPQQAQVHAASDETAPLPLYGFTLPEEPFLLAERTATGYRVFVPPSARVERHRRGEGFHGVPASELGHTRERTWVELRPEERLRLCEGELALHLTHSVAGKSVGLRLRDMGWLAMLLLLLGSVPVGLLLAGHSPERMAESNARALAAARERELAERKRLGVDTPPHPLPPTPQKPDAGVKMLPGNFGVH